MIFLQMNVIYTYLESTLKQDEHLIYVKIPQGCKVDKKVLFTKF